jgi:hypothetical protein
MFTVNFFTPPHILHKVGSAMRVVAAIYVLCQLHRRASAVPPEVAGEMPIHAFLWGELVCQRQALRGICWWYMLPFLPGLALFFAAQGLGLRPTRLVHPRRHDGWHSAACFRFLGSSGGSTEPARRLQKRIG